MKVLQLSNQCATKEWHYSFSIFSNDNDGTEVSPFDERVVQCTSYYHSMTQTMREAYLNNYGAKEIYVQSITEENERD
jgi:hypothetical protein